MCYLVYLPKLLGGLCFGLTLSDQPPEGVPHLGTVSRRLGPMITQGPTHPYIIAA